MSNSSARQNEPRLSAQTKIYPQETTVSARPIPAKRRFPQVWGAEWTSLSRVIFGVSAFLAAWVASGSAYLNMRVDHVRGDEARQRIEEFRDLTTYSLGSINYQTIEYSSRLLLEDKRIASVAITDGFGYAVFGDEEETRSLEGTGLDIEEVPLVDVTSDRPLGKMVYAIQPKEDYSQFLLDSLATALLTFVTLFVVIAGMLQYYFARIVMQPALAVVEAIENMMDTGRPVPAKNVEASMVGRLGSQFNQMQERLRTYQNEQRVLTAELHKSLQSLETEQRIGRMQLDALNEVLESSGQSLIHYDSFGNTTLSILDNVISEVLRHAMYLAAWQPNTLSTYLSSHGYKIEKVPNESFNSRSSFEISGRENQVWSIVTFVLDEGNIGVICHDISDRRAIQEQKVQTQKMDSLGVLASGVAHEYNNILAIIRGNLELLQLCQGDAEQVNGYVDTAMKGVTRASGITQSLLTFARKKHGDASSVFQPGEVLKDLTPIFTGSLPATIKFTTSVSSTVTVSADRAMFESALINLVTNARDAMDGRGEIQIQISDITGQDRNKVGSKTTDKMVLVDVMDDGPGVEPSQVSRLFEPFYTTKSGTGGTGLGLSLVFSFAQGIGGSISYHPTPEGKSRFRLLMPASQEYQETVPKRNPVQAQVADPLPVTTLDPVSVLVIEDEIELLNVMVRGLNRLGFSVHGAEGVVAARHLLNDLNSDPPVQLVLTDNNLADGTGEDVVTLLRGSGMNIPVILISGDTSRLPPQAKKLYAEILQKPASLMKIATTFKTMLAQRAPA